MRHHQGNCALWADHSYRDLRMMPWGHLPNAKHIDRVLANLRVHPEEWGAAWYAVRGAAWDAARSATWDAARSAAWGAARGAVGDAVGDAVWDTAWDAVGDAAGGAAGDAVWDAARSATWNAARNAAEDAVCALVAYDDCAYLLDLSPDVVRAHYALTDEPAALLLLPAVIALSTKV